MFRYLIIPIIFLVCLACEKEDTLTPSDLGWNRIEDSLDMSQPFVKEYYEKYGVAVLTKFDENVDFKFNFSSYGGSLFWNDVELEKMTRQTQIDSVLEILEKDILSCFKDEFEFNGITYKSDFRKKYFPTKILIVKDLVANYYLQWSIMGESVNRTSENVIGTQHCLINDNAMALNLNTETMLSSEENFQRFRKDILYVLITTIIDKFNLYDEIPAAFYEFSSEYYGKSLSVIQEDAGQSIQDISRLDYAENYSIICNSVCPNTDPVWTYFILPDRERDVRLYIDHLMTPEGIRLGTLEPHVYKYSFPMMKKMWYIGHILMNWGIDVTMLNNDLEFLLLLTMTEEQINEFN